MILETAKNLHPVNWFKLKIFSELHVNLVAIFLIGKHDFAVIVTQETLTIK